MSASPPDRRERKKRRTREQIQAAALDLFATRGYRDTTIAAVADAADVAVRTVTGHFPSKEDLLFADEPFTAAALTERLDRRDPGESALDATRDWMRETMQGLDESAARDLWSRRALRARLIIEDEALRGRARGANYALERALAEGVAEDLGQPADALAPRLVALTVIDGLREVYVTHEFEEAADRPAVEELMVLVDEIVAFARGGLAELASPSA